AFEDLEDLHDGQRIHADRHMLAVIFEHAERQDNRPPPGDRPPDLMRQHQLVAHRPASPPVGRPYCIRTPVAGSKRCTEPIIGAIDSISPGRAATRSRKTPTMRWLPSLAKTWVSDPVG